MPAFMFEKISPPASHAPSHTPVSPDADNKQRGVIVKILDRFVETRVKRSLREESAVIARAPKRSPD